MAGEWTETELQEIAAKTDRAFAMGPFGSNIKAENYRESGVPVIRGTNLREAGGAPFVAEDFVFLDEEKADELTSSNCAPGDIVFVAQGTVGKVGIVPETTPYNRFVLSQNLMKVTVDSKLADPRFVFYFYRSEIGQHEIMSRVNPTGVPCISKPLTSLRQFGIRLPIEVKEQRAIAHILGTLDDKIELNRTMNETLEAMARAIFKSWFVDFDPVCAKAEGRDTGLPKEISDLFPDSFEDSELGEIPKGWNIQRFADTVDIIGGGTPKTSVAEYWGGDIPWFSVVDAPNNSEIWVVDTAKKITREGVDNSSTRVLPVGTTIISARGTVGRIALVAVPMAMNQSCYGLRGKAETHGFFTYFATRELVTSLQQRAHGSVFDTITQDTLAGVSLALPPATLIESFETSVGPTLERIRVSLLGSRTLAALRDTLLPKLISGELRLKDAEKFIGRYV
jgi:restriction endonuclease S subunit